MLVLTGVPPAFSAGADLTGVEGGAFAAALAATLRGFTELPCTCLAAVDGPALGAGMQLAAACDLRVATARSVFGIPAARLGLAVDHWTVERLTREVGWPTARAMLLAAETATAEELMGGFVHRLGDLGAALGLGGRAGRPRPAHRRRPQAGARAVRAATGGRRAGSRGAGPGVGQRRRRGGPRRVPREAAGPVHRALRLGQPRPPRAKTRPLRPPPRPNCVASASAAIPGALAAHFPDRGRRSPGRHDLLDLLLDRRGGRQRARAPGAAGPGATWRRPRSGWPGSG